MINICCIILRHLNDSRAYLPQRRGFWRIGGLDGINVPFSICHLPLGCISPHLLSTPGALTSTPKEPTGLQTCWKSCATLPWRSWTLVVALEFRPLRGSEFPVVHGPRCMMHPASPRRSCQGLFPEAQPGTEVFGVGGWALHQILGGQVSHG